MAVVAACRSITCSYSKSCSMPEAFTLESAPIAPRSISVCRTQSLLNDGDGDEEPFDAVGVCNVCSMLKKNKYKVVTEAPLGDAVRAVGVGVRALTVIVFSPTVRIGCEATLLSCAFLRTRRSSSPAAAVVGICSCSRSAAALLAVSGCRRVAIGIGHRRCRRAPHCHLKNVFLASCSFNDESFSIVA